MSWAVGWAAVNLVSFVANQFLSVRLDGVTFAVSSIAFGAVGATLLMMRWERVRPLLRGPFLPEELKHGHGRVVLLLLSGFLVLVLYKALIIFPVHADELVYHMQLPRVAWQTGALPLQSGIDPVSASTAYPNLLVTQQLWIYLGAGAFDPSLVRPIVPIFTALLVLLLFLDTRRWFGMAAAGLAAAALLSVYSFTSLSILLMDEIPVAFYGYLAVRSALDADRKPSGWYQAAVFAGFSALVKYDGLAAFLALGLALAVSARWPPRDAEATPSRLTWKEILGRLAVFFSLGLLPVLPILFRNELRLGNPIYPYFFGGVDNTWLPGVLESISAPSVINALRNFEVITILGTVLVGAVLLGLARTRQWTPAERLLALLILFYLPAYLYYPLASSQIRYLAPILPAVAVLAGRQLAWWSHESAGWARRRGFVILGGLLGVTGALTVWGPVYSQFFLQWAIVIVEVFAVSVALIMALVAVAPRLKDERGRSAVALGIVVVLLVPGVIAVVDEQWDPEPFLWRPNLLPQTQDAYLTQRIGDDWAMWNWMNANLQANATVLSLEPRLFYINAQVVSPMSPALRPTYNMTFPEALAYTDSLGIHFLLDSAFGDNLLFTGLYLQDSPLYQNLGNRSVFQVTHQEGTTVLYAILA